LNPELSRKSGVMSKKTTFKTTQKDKSNVINSFVEHKHLVS